MASRTTNLGLIKPDLDDNIDVTQLNANSDILDDKVQTNANNIEAVKQELPKYLPLTGGTLTGDLQTANINSGGNIYNTTTNRTLTISGGTDYDTGATLELCGKDINDTVYARLHCGDNYFTVSNDGNTYIGGNKALVNGDGDNLKVSTKTGVAVEVNDDNTVYVTAEKIKGKLGNELMVQSPNGNCNLALNNDGYGYLNGQKIMSVVSFDNGYLRYSNDYIEWVTEVTVTSSLGWVNFPLPINTRLNLQVTQTNRRGTRGSWCYLNVGSDTNVGLNVFISAESATVSIRVLGMR